MCNGPSTHQESACTGRRLRSLDDLTQDYDLRRNLSPRPGALPRSSSKQSVSMVKSGFCTGSVRKFLPQKGFGFITEHGTSADIFFHISDLADSTSKDLSVGVVVQYTCEAGVRTGHLQAKSMTIVEHATTLAEPAVLSTAVDCTLRYGREQLLAVSFALRSSEGFKSDSKSCALRTLFVPSFDGTANENPELDDEFLLTVMEARLSKESGADVNNADTFGETDCNSGWSFEEAVAANAKIASEVQRQVLPPDTGKPASAFFDHVAEDARQTKHSFLRKDAPIFEMPSSDHAKVVETVCRKLEHNDAEADLDIFREWEPASFRAFDSICNEQAQDNDPCIDFLCGKSGMSGTSDFLGSFAARRDVAPSYPSVSTCSITVAKLYEDLRTRQLVC